jgi:UDP-N-acetylmuramoylalanine--D-glutamate ligase
LPVRFVLGAHDERDFTPDGADLVVRNPGVPRRAPLLELARAHGIPVEMEMSLFFRACPAPIIGVTGTKGKTTVSTLIGEVLRETFPDLVVAGNMGISALDQLPRLRPGRRSSSNCRRGSSKRSSSMVWRRTLPC